MTFEEPSDRYAAKRDRLARLVRVVSVLRAHPGGIRPSEIARRIDVSPRTVYRDLKAIDEEIGVAVWSEDGKWGVVGDEFLPALKLTLTEAMAVVLSARLMVRYADKYDADLAAAFEKLQEVLPRPLAEHVNRTLTVLAGHPRDEEFSRRVHLLARAWAERASWSSPMSPRPMPPTRRRAGRSSTRTSLSRRSTPRAVPDRLGRDPERTADVQGRAHPRRRPDAADIRAAGARTAEAGTIETTLQRAWDIIADQPPVEVVLRFAPAVASRVLEATWHPSQRVERDPDGSLLWRATVAGTIEIRLWILQWGADVEVLEPPSCAPTWRAPWSARSPPTGPEACSAGRIARPRKVPGWELQAIDPTRGVRFPATRRSCVSPPQPSDAIPNGVRHHLSFSP